MKKYSSKGLEKRKKEREGYSEWYAERAKIAVAKVRYCENCGRKLTGHVSEIAHILPKNLFKSVSTNEDNCLYLCSNFVYGSDGCHDKFDSSYDNARQMEVWPTALERFNKFKHLVEEKNRKVLSNFNIATATDTEN